MKVWICYCRFVDDLEVEGVASTEAIAKEWLAEREAKARNYYTYFSEETELDGFSDSQEITSSNNIRENY